MTTALHCSPKTRSSTSLRIPKYTPRHSYNRAEEPVRDAVDSSIQGIDSRFRVPRQAGLCENLSCDLLSMPILNASGHSWPRRTLVGMRHHDSVALILNPRTSAATSQDWGSQDFFCLVCCLTTLSVAQTLTTARFVGAIRDRTGAAITKAEITAQNGATGDASVSGAGGYIELITRAGTNFLHGAFYGYFRDTALNANDPNLKAVDLSRPVLRRSVYGATVGGPLKKNRAFFFLSYQGTRETNGATDQSLYKSVLIAPVPAGTPGLTDDRSESALLKDFRPILPPGTTSIDPTALALLNAKLPDGRFLIPTPQEDGRVTGTAPSTYHEEQFNSNVDLLLGARDSVAANFFADAPEFWALGGGTFSGGSGLPGFGTYRNVNNRLLSAQEIHTLNSTSVNEACFGYNFIRTSESPQESIRDSDIGVSRPTADTFPGLPLILLARDSAGATIGSSPITVQGSSPSLSVDRCALVAAGKAQSSTGRRISVLPVGCSWQCECVRGNRLPHLRPVLARQV